MPAGGRRPNAGRKKGTVSEPTKQRIAIAEKALTEGLNPLDYMLSILRDETKPERDRFAAAKEAAPYIHPRLAAVEHSGNADKPIETVTRIELTAPDGYSEDRTTTEADTGLYGPS